MISRIGTSVKPRDVLITKVKTVEEGPPIDQSVVYDVTQHGEYACVSSINEHSYVPLNNLKIVRIAFGRIPSIGDKVATRNCQKGTIGALKKGWEMPMTTDGIVLNLV